MKDIITDKFSCWKAYSGYIYDTEKLRNSASGGAATIPVSYTHLDVYKRQELLGLNECLYSNNREVELMEVINYDEAYLKLRKEKEKSLKILKGIIHDGK